MNRLGKKDNVNIQCQCTMKFVVWMLYKSGGNSPGNIKIYQGVLMGLGVNVQVGCIQKWDLLWTIGEH